MLFYHECRQFSYKVLLIKHFQFLKWIKKDCVKYYKHFIFVWRPIDAIMYAICNFADSLGGSHPKYPAFLTMGHKSARIWPICDLWLIRKRKSPPQEMIDLAIKTVVQNVEYGISCAALSAVLLKPHVNITQLRPK